MVCCQGPMRNVLQAVRDIPVPLDSREQLYSQLSGQGFSEGLQQWLGSNLVSVRDEASDKPKLTWTFNLEGAYDMYRQASLPQLAVGMGVLDAHLLFGAVLSLAAQ